MTITSDSCCFPVETALSMEFCRRRDMGMLLCVSMAFRSGTFASLATGQYSCAVLDAETTIRSTPTHSVRHRTSIGPLHRPRLAGMLEPDSNAYPGSDLVGRMRPDGLAVAQRVEDPRPEMLEHQRSARRPGECFEAPGRRSSPVGS